MTRKEAILRAATCFFSEKGFKETSMAELAKAIGVAQGTIFYHFTNTLPGHPGVHQGRHRRRFRPVSRGLHLPPLDMLEGVISLPFPRRDDGRSVSPPAPTRPVPTRRGQPRLQATPGCDLQLFRRHVRTGDRVRTEGRFHRAGKTALIVFAMVDGLVRLNTYRLYDAGTLYNELIQSSRRMLQNNRK